MKNLKGVFNMTIRYYYANVLDTIYAFRSKAERDYFVSLHVHAKGHTIYKKEVTRKLGKYLTYCWFDNYAIVC